MATRSFIAKELPDGKFKYIYCHWDGYVDHNGRVLYYHYNDADKLEELLNLGPISSLAEKVKPDNDLPHSYAESQRDVTVAYARDRGDKNKSFTIAEYEDMIDDDMNYDYIYLFTKENKWKYLHISDRHTLKDLSEELIEDGIPQTPIVKLYNKYVPTQGKADTVGGEIIRAISKIDYRYNNDGDKIGVDYGNETCNSPARFLKENVKFARVLIDEMWGDKSDKKYDVLLEELCNEVNNYVCSHEDLFTTNNTKDSITDYVHEDDECKQDYLNEEPFYTNCKDKWQYQEKQDEENFKKVDAPIIGADGNVFNLIGICRKCLTQAGYRDKSKELSNRVQACGSYDEALFIMLEYVNPCSQGDMDDEM